MTNTVIKYVFRGTTDGFRGNSTSNRIPITCTTHNPAKAFAFAINAQQTFRKKGIIYIADTAVIQSFTIVEANWFESYEEEIGFSVTPGDFQDRCLGFVTTNAMKAALLLVNVSIESNIHSQNLTAILEEIRVMHEDEIEQVVKALREQIKKS